MAYRPWQERRALGTDFAHDWARDHPAVHGRIYPRVLIEAEDGAEALARVRLLEAHGYDALWCPGPHRSDGGDCPLVRGAACPLADEAEVVVSSLDLAQPGSRLVLQAMASEHPELPVIVETTKIESQKWADVLVGIKQVRPPTTSTSLLRAVARAVEDTSEARA